MEWNSLPNTTRELLLALLAQIGVEPTTAQSLDLEQALRRGLTTLEQTQEESRLRNARLEFLATRDPLTGCLNRRSLLRELERLATTRALEPSADRPLCCVMIDVDRFKHINDQHGHAVGDRVLCEVAARLDVAAAPERDGAVVGRYGGDEFCWLLPSTSLHDAVQLAEQVRLAIAASDAPYVTISLGVAEWRRAAQRATDWESLVERADRALYAAKCNGRNRVEVAAADA